MEYKSERALDWTLINEVIRLNHGWQPVLITPYNEETVNIMNVPYTATRFIILFKRKKPR